MVQILHNIFCEKITHCKWKQCNVEEKSFHNFRKNACNFSRRAGLYLSRHSGVEIVRLNPLTRETADPRNEIQNSWWGSIYSIISDGSILSCFMTATAYFFIREVRCLRPVITDPLRQLKYDKCSPDGVQLGKIHTKEDKS